jgi:hypothetical protein
VAHARNGVLERGAIQIGADDLDASILARICVRPWLSSTSKRPSTTVMRSAPPSDGSPTEQDETPIAVRSLNVCVLSE